MMAGGISSVVIWGGWLVVIGCLITASLYTLRIGKWLSGEKAETVSDLLTPSARPSGSAWNGTADYRAAKKEAFTRGSDMEPELRRYFVLARRLRRVALSVALLVIGASWSQSWQARDAATDSQATGQR